MRRERICLFERRRLPKSVEVQQDLDERSLGAYIKQVLRRSHIAWVHGGRGSGKSTLVPTSSMQGEKRGMLHILTKKSAAMTLAHWYRNIVPKWWNMAAVWNGDVHEYPWQRNFVVLSTEMSASHLLMNSERWDEIANILLDEIHKPELLTLVLLEFLIKLLKDKDPRCEGLRFLLVTATPSTTIVQRIKKSIIDAGLQEEKYTLRTPASPWGKLFCLKRKGVDSVCPLVG